MNESDITGEATAADALQAVSDEGLKHGGLRNRLAFLVGLPPWAISVAAALALLGCVLATYLWLKPPTLAEVPVAVLLPSEEAESVKENVERQRQGFELAWKENGVINEDQRRVEEYPFPLDTDEKVESVMDQIKAWYYDEGVRAFIITMSGSALAVGKKFRTWTQDMPDRDRPVLIATVASAPGIADIDAGIFRHYIRSEDESSVLSRYIEQRATEDEREVFLIHISDAYGRQAKRTLVDSGLEMEKVLPIDRQNSNKKDYDSRLHSIIQPLTDPDKHTFVIVVGYGTMVKNMLGQLVEFEELQQRLGSPLLEEFLVVSTFTERLWRPDDALLDKSVYGQIRTLGPDRMADAEHQRGVVYQFSFLTLDKAIKCAREQAKERGLRAFSNCWEEQAPVGLAQDWMPTVELLANGDSYIPLKVLDETRW